MFYLLGRSKPFVIVVQLSWNRYKWCIFDPEFRTDAISPVFAWDKCGTVWLK